jgi:NADPH:quinone reductase-like Zn-dependent oxidoreductase
MICQHDGLVRNGCCLQERFISMDHKARVIRFHQTGGPEVLQIDEIELPPLKNNEVLLKMDALSISRADILWREGGYLEDPIFPAQIGYEGAGVVDSIGPKVNTIKPIGCLAFRQLP